MEKTIIQNRAFDLHINFLKSLDKDSKNILITKLKESLNVKKHTDPSLILLYGAWQDSRDAEEIINEIRNSYIYKTDVEGI